VQPAVRPAWLAGNLGGPPTAGAAVGFAAVVGVGAAVVAAGDGAALVAVVVDAVVAVGLGCGVAVGAATVGTAVGAAAGFAPLEGGLWQVRQLLLVKP
jgi:hypothetical protein